jgi:hypothetical protein
LTGFERRYPRLSGNPVSPVHPRDVERVPPKRWLAMAMQVLTDALISRIALPAKGRHLLA